DLHPAMLILKTQLNTQKEIFLKFINYTVFRGYYSGNKDASFLGQKRPKMRQNRTKIIQHIKNCLFEERTIRCPCYKAYKLQAHHN
ncbi:hypothetical protein, partial [Bacteroides ovatus]|uniref:hypothetical protein n=1 Tax=Bacteroides ovatus TaxID=28116 RepID=UPI001C2F7261